MPKESGEDYAWLAAEQFQDQRNALKDKVDKQDIELRALRRKCRLYKLNIKRLRAELKHAIAMQGRTFDSTLPGVGGWTNSS